MTKDEKAKKEAIQIAYKAGLMIEEGLLKRVNNCTLLENLINNNEELPECVLDKKESIDLVLKYKRYDMLKYASTRNLLRKYNKNETFLEYILRESRLDESINISEFDPFSSNATLRNIADFYITYAKNDLENYLLPLTPEILKMKEENFLLRILTGNKNLLYFLLRKKKTRDLVKKKFVSKSDTKDIDIVNTLKEIEDKEIIDIEDT